MTLTEIENNYGCVAEYNRSMEEDAAYEYKLQEKRYERHRKNNKLLKQAAKERKAIWFAYECEACPYYTSIGMTADEDDVEHGICNGSHSCERYRKEYDE